MNMIKALTLLQIYSGSINTFDVIISYLTLLFSKEVLMLLENSPIPRKYFDISSLNSTFGTKPEDLYVAYSIKDMKPPESNNLPTNYPQLKSSLIFLITI